MDRVEPTVFRVLYQMPPGGTRIAVMDILASTGETTSLIHLGPAEHWWGNTVKPGKDVGECVGNVCAKPWPETLVHGGRRIVYLVVGVDTCQGPPEVKEPPTKTGCW